MRLTEDQESKITRYLRDVSRNLEPELPERDRDVLLSKTRDRIYRKLEFLNRPTVTDSEVDTALHDMGEPAEWRPSERHRPSADSAVWLGVCARLAERAGLQPWVIRCFAVLIGLATGPFALLAYLLGFAELYFSTPRPDRPRVNLFRVVGLPVLGVAIAIALHVGTQYCIDGILYAYQQYLRPEIPPLGQWDWLRPRAGRMQFWVIAFTVPLGMLAGLPMARRWDHSLKRVMQAILCLYGVALSLGIALVITGLVLDIVRDFTT